jgi:methylase of polypeptide subunit release factors
MLEQASVLETGAETPLTLGGAARKLGRLFEHAGLASPRLDARILVAEACGREPGDLILDRDAAVSAGAAGRILDFAARHLAGEPVSRILGRREFWGLTFHITPDTLDPRPETELLVETVLRHVGAQGAEWQQRSPPHPSPLPEERRSLAAAAYSGGPSPRPHPLTGAAARDASSPRRVGAENDRMRGDFAGHPNLDHAPLRILDLGTGSGCILAALLSELPHARGIGVDRSEATLAIARDNLSRLGLRDRASFLCASWMSAIGGGAFDVIVSNPPYIAPSEIRQLGVEVSAYDPYLALDGGEDGLEAYRIIIPQAFAALEPGGVLAFEVGHQQAGAVHDLMKLSAPSPGFSEVRIWPDLAGADRAVAGVRQS